MAQFLGEMMVYPNRMTFDIMDKGGIAPPPKGMLCVKIVRAEGIKSGDLIGKVCAPALNASLAPKVADNWPWPSCEHTVFLLE